MPKVSVIIPTLNRKSDLRSCLESVYLQGYPEIEVIVVDNGSADGTTRMIQEQFPQTIVIENATNVGACAARNQALLLASGEYVWFLDSDTKAASPHCLENMMLLIEANPTLGSVGGELYEDSERRTFVKVKKLLPNAETITQYVPLSDCHGDDGDYLATCNCLVRKQHLIEWGGFDEEYFFLSEDKELGHYLKARGLRNLAASATAVYHYVSKSSGERSLFLKLRNIVRFNVVHAAWWKLPFLPLLDFYYLFRGTKFRDLREGAAHVLKYLDGPTEFLVKEKRGPLFLRLIRVGVKYGIALAAAYLWNLFYLPKTLRTRISRPNFIEQHTRGRN